MKPKQLLLFSLAVFAMVFVRCSTTKTIDVTKEKEGILQADREFSDYSAKNGMKKAFELFGDENMVVLRENSMPVVGKTAYNNLNKNWDDSQTLMAWKPLFADVSISGDLGYSYGVYTFTQKTDSLKTEKGTYLSVWKKDSNGKWKFVVDTGNEGIGEKSNNQEMENEQKFVSQLGGVFIYSENPRELAEWYKENLGIIFESHPDGSAFYTSFAYQDTKTGKKAYTAWSVLKARKMPTNIGKVFTVNYRVNDIQKLVEHLRNNGVSVTEIETYPEGKFAWCEDLEGNHIELWEDTSIE